jgi:hypothetical protein
MGLFGCEWGTFIGNGIARDVAGFAVAWSHVAGFAVAWSLLLDSKPSPKQCDYKFATYSLSR